MIPTGCTRELGVRLSRSMAMPAGEVQTDLARSQATVGIELADDRWIDGNHVSWHISHKSLGISCAALDEVGHMAVCASDIIGNMGRVILDLGFLPMAIGA
jgi:hypothetical protein